MPSRFKTFVLCCALLMLVACTTSQGGGGKRGDEPLHSAKLPDFSGHWEKNYQASDVFRNKFELYVSDIRRTLARGNIEANGEAMGVNAQAINGLAQLAEEITRMPLLNIKQDEAGINVERENDFNLRCFYHDKQYVLSSNAFGNEKCGWNSSRMLFQMYMAGGLQVSHQFSLSPDGSQLNVTTMVSSTSVSSPIVISNYYTRFASQDDNYDCKQTLTRNRVCSQQGRSK